MDLVRCSDSVVKKNGATAAKIGGGTQWAAHTTESEIPSRSNTCVESRTRASLWAGWLSPVAVRNSFARGLAGDVNPAEPVGSEDGPVSVATSLPDSGGNPIRSM